MNKKVNKIIKAVANTVVALVVIIAILLVGVRIFGLQVFTVLSPSMTPKYPTGSVIYVREVSPKTLQTGDVITFTMSGGISATHRIVEVIPSEDNADLLYFRTKGDANKTVDPSLVSEKNIIGTPVFTIPLLGFVANFVQNPPGLYLSVAVGLILVVLVFMADVITTKTEEKE